MATIVLIVIAVMIVAMVVYIRAVSKVDRAENDFRKESSTIDTFLWDIQHRLKKSGDILEKYEIDASEIRDGDSLGLGMPTSFQVLKFSQYSEKIKKLEDKIEQQHRLLNFINELLKIRSGLKKC